MGTTQSRASDYMSKSTSVRRGSQVGSTPVQKRMSAEANSPGQASGMVKQVFKGPTAKR